jgi:hypothetical protein
MERDGGPGEGRKQRWLVRPDGELNPERLGFVGVVFWFDQGGGFIFQPRLACVFNAENLQEIAAFCEEMTKVESGVGFESSVR